MATIRDTQENTRSITDLVEEIKDDVELLELRGEFDPQMLFELYQKLDDLSDLIESTAKLSLKVDKS